MKPAMCHGDEQVSQKTINSNEKSGGYKSLVKRKSMCCVDEYSFPTAAKHMISPCSNTRHSAYLQSQTDFLFLYEH